MTRTLHVELDAHAGLPAHEQIRLQVLAHVATRRLAAGDELPAARELAARLGIASGTVQRAYRELARAGLLVVDGSAKPYLEDVPASVPTHELRTAAVHLATRVREAGHTEEQVLDLVRRALLGHLGAGDPPPPPVVPQPRAPFEPAADLPTR